MLSPNRRFRDRVDAGRQLAAALRGEALDDPLVLAIPRGGVIVGAAIADELGAELDVVLVRKLRHPSFPECAVGAIGEDGRIIFDRDVAATGVTPEYLRWERQYQASEIDRRRRLFRVVRPPAAIAGRTVILADDGIATGSTAATALAVVRSQSPAAVVLAVPVACPERLAAVAAECDRVVCLASPPNFRAVAEAYEDFHEVTDDEAVKLLHYLYRPDAAAHFQEAIP